MKFPKKQQGLSVSGWLFLIVLIGGMVSLIAKLAPYYFDFNTVSAVLDTMSREQGMVDKTVPEIRTILVKRMKLNNIRDFDIDHRMTITRAADRTTIEMKYEARVPLAGNVDIVANFEKNVQLRD